MEYSWQSSSATTIDETTEEEEENQPGQAVTFAEYFTGTKSLKNVTRKYKVSYELSKFAHGVVETATKNFSDFISENCDGYLYKGTIYRPKQEIAVKVLVNNGENDQQRYSREVLARMAHNISRANHPNIAKFVGYCNDHPENHHFLVYEYVSTPLFSYLHDSPKRRPLDWETRMKIAYGVAKALDYLHNTMMPRVVYRDLDSWNILLDEKKGFHPKLSGLGMTQFSHTENSAAEIPSSVEYNTHCFGAILLELLTGQKQYEANRGSNPGLIDWVMARWTHAELKKEIQDSALKVEAFKFWQAIELALSCTRTYMNKAPDMESVISNMEYIMGNEGR